MGNRFTNGTLNRNFGTKLLDFRFNGRTFEVRTTDHSLDQFKARGVNIDEALGSIVALGKTRLYHYADTGIDTAILDEEQQHAVILTFEKEGSDYVQIRIATIIGRYDVWVKKGTRVFRLFKDGGK
jgi:hypothetical protein